MKASVIGLLVLAVGVGAFAQANTWYVAVLPGYQFSTGNYQEKDYFAVGGNVYEWRVNGSGKNNFTGSLDLGYYFTDNVGVHFAYIYNQGKYQANLHLGPYYLGNYQFNRSINIAEVGPEFVFGSKESQGYIQVNLGYTFGNSTPNFQYQGVNYPLGDFGTQSFVYGAAVGYRYYFNDSVGLAVQGAYHHLQHFPISDLWDGRVGITFRF